MKNDYKWQIRKDCESGGGVGVVYGNTMVSPKEGKSNQISVSQQTPQKCYRLKYQSVSIVCLGIEPRHS
jgi:hypothetical protein